MTDLFYTPPWLADRLISLLPESISGEVLDPCAGEGALLEAVEKRFGNKARALAIDYDSGAINSLKARHPGWVVSRANFLHPNALAATRVYRTAILPVDAVVMNPPFSYRGNGGVEVKFRGFHGNVSPAVAFVINAIERFQPREGLWAIMPIGSLRSVRHSQFWRELSGSHDIEDHGNVSSSAFRGARATTRLLAIKPRNSPVGPAWAGLMDRRGISSFRQVHRCLCIDVVRGRVPRHAQKGKAESNQAPYFHTTDFNSSSPRATREARLATEGPFLAIARVGAFKPPLLVELDEVVLSDCVIAIRPRDTSVLAAVHESLAANMSPLIEAYQGTGAPYVTLADVRDYLEGLGWNPRIVGASAASPECRCVVAALAEYGSVEAVG
jgi:hypothetical protein